ncbi:MAG: GspH/FimT family pseudopilin [Betaproteobacteria bacterium]|nr:GspH/FimT family pseudopilin [Betaproteobacteria bacterium]
MTAISKENSSIGAAFEAFLPAKAHQCWGFSFRSARKGQRGVTLIELLVVVLLLGIAVSVASAKLFQTDGEKLQLEGERLMAALQFARDEAAFGGRIVAVSVTGSEIRFLERDLADPSRWNASAIAELQPRMLPDAFTAELRVGALANQKNPSESTRQTNIVFLPIGVAAPFELTLQSPAGARHISGDALGNLKLGREPA